MRIVHTARLGACLGARLVPALALAFLSTSALAEISITIDKSSQRMSVARDGALLHTWPVSTGKAGYRTPNGSFKAFRMEKDHFSREWDDAPMPHSIFFTKKGHAIHGYLDTRNIGRPASHGCVRLEPKNAATLFALVKEDGVLNTTVTITGHEPPSSGVPMARRSAPSQEDEALLQQEREQAARYYRERGYAYPPRGYDPNRYAYENAPPPSYYRQPQVYGQPYYAQPRYEQRYTVQPQYRQRYYYEDAPPGYYRRPYGYGWN